MDNFLLLLILQLASCAFMVGLIWTIQIVHYPSFSFIPIEQFSRFHSFHTQKITYVVLPVMLVELVTSVLLGLESDHNLFLLINIFGVLLIWISTLFVSVPLHNSLGFARAQALIDRFILTNWVRTFIWSARLFLLIYFIVHFFQKQYRFN